MKKILIPLLLLPLTLFAEVGYVEPWGTDAQLNAPLPVQKRKTPLSPMGLIAEKTILFHHRVLTHISGPRSSFRPTSSQYMLEAIREYGFIKGYLMGCDRLLRENPDPWVYRTKVIGGKLHKWDSPKEAP